MSDNEDISQASQSITFGAIGSLANHPLLADPNASKQPEPNPNEITTNIIKDASKVASNNDYQNNDNEDSQGKINGDIDDLQSESIIPDDNNLSRRKSITSGHLIDNQENSSTPAIVDSSSNNPTQGPIRSMSESNLIDHHDASELPSTLPIQQDESSIDGNDLDTTPTDTKNETIDGSQQSLNPTKQNGPDETARFGTTSRTESASSKRSPSISSDKKRTRLPDETGTDTDRDNQEVANIARRPSRSKSPLNRPRSPTPDDSRKTLTNNIESNRPQSSSLNDHKKEEEKQTSRPSSTAKSKSNDNSSESSTNQSNNDFLTTNEQSKLIKLGEQLQIPTNDMVNQQINSPPPSPAATKQMVLTNPLLEGSLIKTNQDGSRPTSQTNGKRPLSSSISNEKIIDGDVVSSKSRRSSNTSQQQRPVIKDGKPNSSSSRKGSNTSKQKSLKDQEEQTVIAPIKIDSTKSRQENKKRLSTTDSENEHLNTSKSARVNSSSQATTPTQDKQTTHWTKQVQIQSTDDEIPRSRPQSPDVEQIAERNQHSKTNKKRNTDEQKKKEQHRPLRRSNSVESFNHIPLVDDKSLDSTSGNNTESENPKQRRIKSKKKDMETNTDSQAYLRNGNHQQQQQQESTSQKPFKANKPMSDHSQSIRRRITKKEQNLTTPDTEPDSNKHTIRRSVKQSKDSNEDKDPVNVNVTVLVKNMTNENDGETLQKRQDKQRSIKPTIDSDRHTQSDTEQIITEKQKKRRRPKRISRTTQTYERYFRAIEREQHKELRPTNDTDKSVQTRRSLLRPRTRSPKRHYPIYLSTDAFKMEEILPKQFPQTQRNISKTSVIARSNSPQGGKLLILRPTLPFHHTDAVNVQRISLQYAIDLIPNENKPTDSAFGQRNKFNALKQSEQTNNLPMIRSSSTTTNTPTNKSNTQDKSVSNRIEDRINQRKNGGTV